MTAYPDGPGRWSIGYGTKSFEGERITEYEALKRMCGYLAGLFVELASRGLVGTDGQMGALLSFAYNVGRGNLLRSSLWRKHLAKDYAGAADEFLKWTRHNGKHYKGLLLRRQAERRVYIEQKVRSQ